MLKRLERWLGYAGGGLVAVLIAVDCVVYAWSSLRFVRGYAIPAEHTEFRPDTALGARGLFLTGRVKLISAEAIDHSGPHVKAPAPGPNAPYGEYLSWVSGCRECHGEGLSGGHIPGTSSSFKRASNLTPAGIGRYSEADFVRAMR